MIEFVKMKFNFWYIATAFIFIVCLIVSCSQIFMGEEDGLIEEVTEDMIQHVTGINVDLSQNSPETKGFL